MVADTPTYMVDYRFKSASETLWEAYPEGLLGLARFITELGGAEGIILLLALLYWLSDRERVVLVAALAVTGIALILALKGVLALPRPVPDPAVAVEPVLDHGDDVYGFPSGHAFNAVAIYGGLLYFFEKHRDPKWVLPAGVLVVAIALSRVVLRVHYLGDLLFGAALALVFLVVMAKLMDDDPRIGFGAGLVCAILAVVITGERFSVVVSEEYALITLGIAIGGLVASFRLDIVPDLQSRIEGTVLAVAGIGSIVLFMVIYSVAVDQPGTAVDALLIVALHAALIVTIFFLPVATNRLEDFRVDTRHREPAE